MNNTPETEIRGFDDEKPKKSFTFPKWGIITGVILAVLVGIALVIPAFLDQAKYKDLIISKVKEASGYDVTWAGDIGISILPVPHASMNELTVSNAGQKILSVKKAEVSVQLAPLFQKQIEIANVSLDTPDVNLVVDANGRQTWMTEKLNEPKTEATPSEPAEKSNTQAQSFSLDSVDIKNGHIVYKDLSKGSTQEVSNLNTDLYLKTLKGPFDVKADLVYNGNKIELKGKAGEIGGDKPASVDVDIKLPELNVSGNYKGEVNTGDALSVKGDLKLAAKDLEKTITALSKAETKLPDGLNGALDLTTALIYDGNQAALDNLVVELGDLAYKGNLKVSGLKEATPLLNIDLVSTSDKGKSKEGLVKILSSLSVKGAGTFVNNVASINNGVITFDGQMVNLSGTYALPAKQGAKALVNATIQSAKLDIDELSQQISPTTESAAQKAINAKNRDSASSVKEIKGVALPFNGNIKGAIGSLRVAGQSYSNVNFDLTANGNALTINNFALNAPADTTVVAKGTIGDTAALSGLNVNANVRTGNVEALAKAYKMPLALEQRLGAASVAGNFSGSLNNLAFNATADALSFAVTAAGSVQNVTATPAIKTLNVRVRHPSLQTAVRNFSPGFEAPGSFNGPLDVSTTLALADKKYDLTNLKGQIGSTSLAGTLSANMNGEKPDVKGDLSFGNMVFESGAPKAGTTSGSSKPSSAPATTAETRWSREAIDTTWMNKFNADLSIKVASITQGYWKLNNAALAFKLNNGNLNISNMSANALGGNATITGEMKGGTAKAPLSMNWNAKATNINAQMLMSALQNKPSDTLSGTIENVDVSISSSGISPAALVYALNGKGNASGNNIVVKGVDAAKLAETARGSFKPLERAGSLFASFKDGQTAFSTFNAAFTIANGVINFSEIKFDGAQALLVSKGNVNLPRWTVDLKNTMTVKNSDIPAFDFAISGPLDNPVQTGGSVIEGFLRGKAQEKLQDLLKDKLGDKIPAGLFGGSTATTPATTTTAPAATTDGTTPAAPVEKTKEQKKQEQIEQGVKALQGLFGQ